MKSLQELSERELEELLMTETKKFTSSRNEEWGGEDRQQIRLRIEEIQHLLEIKTGYYPGRHERNEFSSANPRN